MSEDNDIASQIEADVKLLEIHSSRTGSLRSKIVDKLAKTVEEMTIDPNGDKASAIEAKMGIISTLLKAISDSDSQKVDLIKLKQRIKADNIAEVNSNIVSETVSAFMKKLNVIASIESKCAAISSDSKLLDKAAEELIVAEPILDAELEMTTKSAKDIEK